MRGKEVNAPELEQNNALGRTERSKLKKGLPGRRLVEPGRSGRHSLKCAICNHPDRAAIEFDFLNWRNPGDLVRAYRFRGLSTIYRHAHATGLFARRRLNLRFAMERIVERVNEVPVTATSVIRAARAITRINDSGEWVDPPSRVIVTHINSDAAEDSARLESSRTRRSHRQKCVSHSRATSHSPLATVFDPVLLDEPSESAPGELPKIDAKPPETEIVLEIAPPLYRAVQARREAAQVRLAPWSNAEPERAATDAAIREGVPTHREQEMTSSPSSPPSAASNSPATPAQAGPCCGRSAEGRAGTVRAKSEAARGTEAQSVASSSSLPPQAASNSPATAMPAPPRPDCNQQSRRPSGPQLGSSASADPPFPFGPEPLRRWKHRRRF